MNIDSISARLALSSSCVLLTLGGCTRLADLDDREGFSSYGDEGFEDEDGDDDGGSGNGGDPISESCYDGITQPGELCLDVEATSTPAGVDPCSLSVADFDEDGRPDLAVPNSDPFLTPASTYVANVLRGYGNGNFASGEPIAAGQELPVGLAVGDFDGDGHVDIATANNAAQQAFVMTNGGGAGMSFAEPSGISVDSTASSISAGDIDGDGRDDLAVNTPDGIALLRGGPGGAEMFDILDVGSGQSMHNTLADMDQDGNLDVVAAVSGGEEPRVVVFHGAGDGSFPERVEHTLGGDPWWVVAGDLNMDGDPDLLVAEYGADTVSILLGNGQGGFSPRTQIAVCEGPQSVAIADMNSDGANDIVVGCMDSDRVELWLQGADGVFDLSRWWATGIRPVSVQVADLDLDGVPDIAWANQLSDTIGVVSTSP